MARQIGVKDKYQLTVTSHRNQGFGNILCCGRYSRRIFPHAVHLVFLPFVQGHGLPLAGMFPVYLAVSFVPAAVLTAMSSPVSKAVKKLA